MVAPDSSDSREALRLDPLDVRTTQGRVLQQMFGFAPEPTKVDRFVIERTAGHGAMGRVYVAHDPTLNRRVAVKMIAVDAADDEGRAEKLLEEGRTLARLADPNVVEIYAVGRAAEGLFIAMEFVAGETMEHWIARGPHGFADAWPLLRAAGRGLSAAHAQGIVHRDFKPSNVLMDRVGGVKVADFGLATVTQAPGTGNAADGESDGGSAPAGTPQYMAPEQWDSGAASPRSDQYSFCVVARHAIDLAKAPARVRRAIERGLHLDPARRFPSMHALLAEIDSGGARLGGTAVWVGAVVSLAVIGAAVWSPDERSGVCSQSEAGLSGVWDEATRDTVHTALVATNAAYVEDVWPSISASLDAYAKDWVETHREVCAATSLRGERSQAALQQSMACLAGRRREMRAVVTTLLDADASVVANAPKLGHGLPPVRPCSGDELTQERVPGPLAQSVADARDVLARARALRKAGRYVEARRTAVEAWTAARRIGYPLVAAEANHTLGLTLDSNGEYQDAAARLETAYAASIALGEDALALRCAVAMVFVEGERLGNTDGAERWSRIASALLDRTQMRGTLLAAELSNNIGVARFRATDYPGARQMYVAALELRQALAAPDDPQIAESLTNLGLVEGRLGRGTIALGYHDQAVELIGDALGVRHPQYAELLANQSNAQLATGATELALATLLRALEIQEATLGAEHPKVAGTLLSIGLFYLDVGRDRDAVIPMERALAIRTQTLGADHIDVATAQINLAAIEVGLDLHEKALTRLDAAERTIVATLGEEHQFVSVVRSNKGVALRGLGRLEEGLAALGSAVRIERAMGGPSLSLAAALDDYGSSLTGLGRSIEALEFHNEALSIFTELDAHRGSLAITLMHLGTTYVSLERLAEGLDAYERALEHADAAWSPGHTTRVELLMRTAEAHVGLKQFDEATSVAQTALELAEAEELGPARIGEASIVLATARCGAGDRTRAATLLAVADDAGFDTAGARAACSLTPPGR